MYPAEAGSHGRNPQQGHPAAVASRPWDSHHQPQHQAYPYPPPPNGFQHRQQPPPPPHPVHSSRPPPRESAPASAPPPSQIRPDRPEMAAIHSQQHYSYPPPYLPAPASLYPQQHDYRAPPPQSGAQPQVQQSAPRQRTAIACKYCRRRKIRCSGFENSEDGRCSNCVRFNQECVFTPVSAQTQAFVPAQALYRRAAGGPPPGPPQQLYGPYGNRLPPQDPHAYPPPPPGQQPQYTLPSPTSAYPPPGQPYPYPPPPQNYPEPPSAGGRRRRDEPHTPNAPPPNPGEESHMAHRQSYGGAPPGYHYPDPQGHSAGSPHAPPAGYGGPPQPYYGAPAPPRRNSPGSNSGYSYDASRTSHSPHSAPPYGYPSASGAPGYGQAPTSGPPPRHSPPHSATDRSRGGMSIHDMVSGESSGPERGERSAADSSMLSALNRPTKR